MARSPRHRALDGVLHRLRRQHAEEILRPLSQGRGHRLAGAAPGAAPGAPPRRALRRATRERMAPRADAVDEILLKREYTLARRRPRRRCCGHHLRGLQRRRHLHHDAHLRRHGSHRPHSGQALRVLRVEGCGPLPRRARLLAQHGRSRIPGRTRPAHPHRAGLAESLAQETRP